MDLKLVQDLCHNQSREMGWWSDLQTGAAIDPVTIVPEKLMLIVTEVSEAMEGFRKHLMDDKLSHRSMFEVELADTIIRVFDLAGALNMDMEQTVIEKLMFNRTRPDHQLAARAAPGGKSI